MSRSWAGGSTRRWRRIRKQVLDRDNHTCRLLLPGCEYFATHVHHTAGKAAGDDPATLVAACRHCNLKVGDPRASNPTPTTRTRW